MGESKRNFSFDGRSPLFQLLISILIIFLAGIFLFPVLLLAGAVIWGGYPDVLLNSASSGAGEKEIWFVRYMMISQEISIFIIPALVIFFLMKQPHQKYLIDFQIPEPKDIILVIILAICILPLTGYTGQLNSEMHFPGWLKEVENWMKAKEDNAARLVDLLIPSDTFGIMIFNVFMLAVVPAIGEEFIFRGVFQKTLCKLFKSGHPAIWITAFAFSALHFQFFGFIPRFILGLVFGYLFYWSGTIWLPVISHFVNNAIPVSGAYFQEWNSSVTGFGMVKWQQNLILPFSIIIIIVILQYFRSRYKSKLISADDANQNSIL
jgi:uncharacterized protein